MKQSPTIHFVSLGCPKNRVDTEVMLGVSERASYQLVDDSADADVIVVNTCGFIDAAKQESIETIIELGQRKREGRCRRLVVAGCLSQRYPEELAAELPEVDHFLGSSDMLKLEAVLSTDRGSTGRMLVGNPAEHTMRSTDPRRLSGPGHRAYVKIAEGCNRSCGFCAIPSFRGKQRSRTIDDIVAEVRSLAARGTVEFNLISQDTIAYGRDLRDGTTLAALLRRVAEVDGVQWVRVFYLFPEAISDELIALYNDHPKILPYVDMPLQHASDRMLRAMRRGGADRLRPLVERLRGGIDGLVFRTAFIVGHPGETEADFQALTDFVRWGQFEHVGVFRYSPEEGTASAALPDHPEFASVDPTAVEAREQELMELARSISRTRLQALVGQRLSILVEGESDESEFLLSGRYYGQAPEIDGQVILTNGTAAPGEFREAQVIAAGDYDLVADLELEPSGAGVRLPVFR